jgi:hypothetical protein
MLCMHTGAVPHSAWGRWRDDRDRSSAHACTIGVAYSLDIQARGLRACVSLLEELAIAKQCGVFLAPTDIMCCCCCTLLHLYLPLQLASSASKLPC